MVESVDRIRPSWGATVAIMLLLGHGALTGLRGQTPGRWLLGISVVRDDDGSFLGAWRGLVRLPLHVFDIVLGGLGFLWPLWDEKWQTFADKMIHSVVIRVDRHGRPLEHVTPAG